MTQDAGYTISSEVVKNDEGSDFVTVWIDFAEGDQIVERFSGYFDDPGPSAVEQAASYIGAFEESQMYTLEERLGPYGIEWEREQEERMYG
jgi:hypothetical protein